MVEEKLKFRKTGTSIGLLIPSHIVKLLEIKLDQEVIIYINDDRSATLEIKTPKERSKNDQIKTRIS